jgi:hypothetical protein
MLNEGQQYPIEIKFRGGAGDDYFQLGFVYHGTEEAYNMGSHGPLWQNKGGCTIINGP